MSDNDNDVNLKFLSPANYSRHQESHFTKASGCSFLTALGKSSYGRGLATDSLFIATMVYFIRKSYMYICIGNSMMFVVIFGINTTRDISKL